jgi:hypothetical protein
MITFVVVSIVSPILIGVYKKDRLIEQYKDSDRASEALPILFFKAYNSHKPQKIVYANGPGSFTSIKLTYIFLKAISIIKNLQLFSVDSFYFCDNRPIKAIGKSCFIKNRGRISIQKIDKPLDDSRFYLPTEIEFTKFSVDAKPLYVLPSV